MSSALPTLNPRVVPVLQGGGGQPSSVEASQVIESFAPSVMKHLTNIHYDLFHGHTASKDATTTFLTGVQQEPATTSVLDKDLKDQRQFFEYMASPASSAMAPPRKHDLTHPISDYFISTSHNTYLSGNQLYGEASTAAYTNVLVRGCRCLEIDVWDGEPKSPSDSEKDEDSKRARWEKIKARAREHTSHNKDKHPGSADTHSTARVRSNSNEHYAEPRVLHGHTLTKEVSFRAVCNAIRDSAFVATDLPVIVSLEIHAGLEQQEIMVEIMQETWKGMLVDTTAEERAIKYLPSPEELRRKILIKVKWTPDTKTGESNNPLDHVVTNSSNDDDLSQSQSLSNTPKQKKASKVLLALSHLGVYTRAYSFKQFNQPEAAIPTHVFSLSEKKVLDMHESNGSDLFTHNRNYLMRVFPSSLRINSSNVEPTFLWHQGAQMVALNWQKLDRGMMLNEGMFAGEEGWVLKPDGFHSTLGPSSSPEKPIKRGDLKLTVQLLAAQNIPLPSGEKESHHTLHPYVNCQLHVDSDKSAGREDDKDETNNKFKRRSEKSRGTDPDFHGETLQWSSVPSVIEDLSFLRIKIEDDRIGKDELVAWACIKLDRLQSGYRFIHLLDVRGMQSEGVLLVRITKHIS